MALPLLNNLPHSLALIGYTPFVSPLPVWDYWYLLLIPLCLAVAIVYKAIKVPHLNALPSQAVSTTGWILAGMCAAGAALAIVVEYITR